MGMTVAIEALGEKVETGGVALPGGGRRRKESPREGDGPEVTETTVGDEEGATRGGPAPVTGPELIPVPIFGPRFVPIFVPRFVARFVPSPGT